MTNKQRKPDLEFIASLEKLYTKTDMDLLNEELVKLLKHAFHEIKLSPIQILMALNLSRTDIMAEMLKSIDGEKERLSFIRFHESGCKDHLKRSSLLLESLVEMDTLKSWT